MKFNVTQVIGLNTDQKAAQVISELREGETYFFAVLDLACDDAFTKGRQVLSDLADFYFDYEGTPAERLNATFEESKKRLPFEEFSLLLSSISGKILYLIGKGGVEVYLKRLDKLSPLLSVGAASQLISGFLQADDRLLLGTSSLIAFLGQDLEKSLNLSLETFEEELSDRIGASDLENQGLAALLVEAQQEESIKLPPLQPEQGSLSALEASVFQDTTRQYNNSVLSVKKSLAKLLNFLWSQKKYFPKSGRGRLVIAAILIVIIILGVGFKVLASKEAQKQADFKVFLQGAKDDFSAAKSLATLDPADAKNKLDSSKDKLSKALILKPNDTDAQSFKKQVEGESSSILLQSNVSDFPVFLDLDLIKKNFRANQISMSNGKLLALDPGVKTLVVVDLAKKSNQILAGSEQLGDAMLVSLNGQSAFVYSKDKGVLKIDITNSKLSVVIKKDPNLGEIRDIFGFGGNIYLLDTVKSQIWKYIATSDGYSDSREYLSKDTKVDLSNSLKMQIESSIYVLKNGGEILRFTRGDKDNFSIGGLDKNIKNPKSFYVSSDTDNLYLLDSGNSRLLILTKTGVYKGQITGGKFATATDLVVDEAGKKVYLLDGSKIYAVDLK